jgi:hypothetical protein
MTWVIETLLPPHHQRIYLPPDLGLHPLHVDGGGGWLHRACASRVRLPLEVRHRRLQDRRRCGRTKDQTARPSAACPTLRLAYARSAPQQGARAASGCVRPRRRSSGMHVGMHAFNQLELHQMCVLLGPVQKRMNEVHWVPAPAAAACPPSLGRRWPRAPWSLRARGHRILHCRARVRRTATLRLRPQTPRVRANQQAAAQRSLAALAAAAVARQERVWHCRPVPPRCCWLYCL